MTISGFTMVRNAGKFYFPIKESISSALPLVDEFIVALGDCDDDDDTRTQIESIQSDKVKIIDRVWNAADYKDGKVFADETTFALKQCKGDWCLYLQADEVLHEKDLDNINQLCHKYLHNNEVDGFLFNYHHFWGDYNHLMYAHSWYKHEIRIVRNMPTVYSYQDAVSFRKGEGKKLNVVALDAYIYHYGWVRPPDLMKSKRKEQDAIHRGETNDRKPSADERFDYGPLGALKLFRETHPAVMQERVERINWKHLLDYAAEGAVNRPLMKHERLKYRILTFIENNFLGGREIFGRKNWKLLKG
jgi:hypothetical protein